MYSQSFNTIARAGMALFMAAALCTGCERDNNNIEKPGKETEANFIPEKNKKFIYKVETDGGGSGTATQWITGTDDSSGITLHNLHTVVETGAGAIMMDEKLFALNGKTYTAITIPDAWYQSVEMLDQLPYITVTKAEIFGYPAFMAMENPLKNGSTISFVSNAGDLRAQLIEYTNNGTPGSSLQEITQLPGTATVEKIEVPAGSFTCNKFSYEINTKITSKIGTDEETANGNEKITLWVAHGIGMVKQESTANLVSFIPLPTGEIKKIETNSSSTTTLQKIE